MLDPEEQKKGGFGAHAARERERHDLWLAGREEAKNGSSATDATDATEAMDATTSAMPRTPDAAPPAVPGTSNARADKRMQRPGDQADGGR